MVCYAAADNWSNDKGKPTTRKKQGSQANEDVKKQLSRKGEQVLSPKAGRNLRHERRHACGKGQMTQGFVRLDELFRNYLQCTRKSL